MLAASRELPPHFPGLAMLPSFKRTIFYIPLSSKNSNASFCIINCRLYFPFYWESTRKLPRAPTTLAGWCLDPFIMLLLLLLWMSCCLCSCLQPKSGETRNHALSSPQGLRLQPLLSPSSSSFALYQTTPISLWIYCYFSSFKNSPALRSAHIPYQLPPHLSALLYSKALQKSRLYCLWSLTSILSWSLFHQRRPPHLSPEHTSRWPIPRQIIESQFPSHLAPLRTF